MRERGGAEKAAAHRLGLSHSTVAVTIHKCSVDRHDGRCYLRPEWMVLIDAIA